MGLQSLTQMSTLVAKTVSTKVDWPNQITEVPAEIFGADYVSIGAGFLVPGRSTGSVDIVNLADGNTFPISKQKKGWFYHRVIWHDMNGDGRLDAVTARAKKPIFGGSDGEIVWLEQPANPLSAWPEHFITKGPDVNFVLEDLDNDGQVEIIGADFFSKKLTVHWLNAGTWEGRTIDATLGAAFDLERVDLNGDGIKDLLVTNHEADASKAGIFAYEIPTDWKLASWTRHTLRADVIDLRHGCIPSVMLFVDKP